ncbi:hypothetical protein ACHAPT_006315 [Fusarium lateritium]
MACWGLNPRWMARTSILGREAVHRTGRLNVKDMRRTLTRAYEYALPEAVEEFKAWKKMKRPPSDAQDLNANTPWEVPDAKPEQPGQNDAQMDEGENSQDDHEALMQDSVLDGLDDQEDANQGSMLSLGDGTATMESEIRLDNDTSQDTIFASDDKSSTLEDVFQLDDEEVTDIEILWEDAVAFLNGFQLEEGDLTWDATSQSQDESPTMSNSLYAIEETPALDITPRLEDEGPTLESTCQMEDWIPITPHLANETLDTSPHAEEETPSLDIAPQMADESQTSDVGPQQHPINSPETTRDRIHGLIEAKIRRNDLLEVQLTAMNLPSLKPSVRGTQAVPQGREDDYDKAVIQIEELKGLCHCIREMKRYLDRMKWNYKEVKRHLEVRANKRRIEPRRPRYYLKVMKSKGYGSRLGESIGIDDAWPEGEWGMPLARKRRRVLRRISDIPAPSRCPPLGLNDW